ncbi:type II secretion system protein [Planctomycetota bacterium]
MSGKRGFTLIELLVVIATIALLLAILMPALRRAREQGKGAVCQSNLRQLYIAAFLWGQDNDDWTLPATWDRQAGEIDGTPGLLSSYLSAEARGKGIYECPAFHDSGDFVPAWLASEVDWLDLSNSYGINGSVVSPGEGPGTSGIPGEPPWCEDWGPDCAYFYDHGNTKLMSVRNPYYAIYLMDCTSWIAADWWFSMYTGLTQIELGRRHRISTSTNDAGLANILWFDGHTSPEPDDFTVAINPPFEYDCSSKYFLGRYVEEYE